MLYNGHFDHPKVILYCQVGKALDMLDFSLNQAIKNAGLPEKDFDIFMVCWKTSKEVYQYLDEKGYKHINMNYDADKGFLWNLYKGWNLGLDVGFKHAPFVCPIATDHAFYKDWLKNLMKYAKSNRIVNCKLIEPGTLPTLHMAVNLGLTLPGKFKQEEFDNISKKIYKNQLIKDEKKYGHRLDAMPWVCSKDVWKRFGPQAKTLLRGSITGDVDFFDRCKKGGVENTKALNAISYHCGGLETARNVPLIRRIKQKVKQALHKILN